VAGYRFFLDFWYISSLKILLAASDLSVRPVLRAYTYGTGILIRGGAVCTNRWKKLAERIDVRLTEEDKARLAELAKQKGVSMTDLIRIWITRGDVVHVLAEQLQDISNDFAKWHVLENRNTSVRFLCDSLRNMLGSEQEEGKRIMIYHWIEFFNRSFQLMTGNVSEFKEKVAEFVGQSEPKRKEVLVKLVVSFGQIITLYNNIFLEGFIDILQVMDKRSREHISQAYNDELRTRYNEITSKYEDFLKRAQRELGESLEHAMPRAKEFRPTKEEEKY
jgi:hypothetical protein